MIVAHKHRENEDNRMSEAVRLNKYLAECGVCSRREADRLIEAGKVVVNGAPATMGVKVSKEDTVLVNGKKLQGKEEKVVLAFYKPQGVVCSEKDAHAERLITEYTQGYPLRLTYAGRLDKDSEGLILLTNDGALIQNMMRASEHHEKEYLVRVNKEINEEFLNKMRKGILLPELKVTTRECEVFPEGKYTFRIILTQGLNKQIRRMCTECDYKVTILKRTRVMNIRLNNLNEGTYRRINGNELRELYEQAGMYEE